MLEYCAQILSPGRSAQASCPVGKCKAILFLRLSCGECGVKRLHQGHQVPAPENTPDTTRPHHLGSAAGIAADCRRAGHQGLGHDRTPPVVPAGQYQAIDTGHRLRHFIEG